MAEAADWRDLRRRVAGARRMAAFELDGRELVLVQRRRDALRDREPLPARRRPRSPRAASRASCSSARSTAAGSTCATGSPLRRPIRRPARHLRGARDARRLEIELATWRGRETMHDLVIRGGTIVDGTGGAPREGDVAIDGGRIAAVGRGRGARRARRSTRAASSSRPASSTSTRTTTARPPGTRCSRRRAGTASPRW